MNPIIEPWLLSHVDLYNKEIDFNYVTYEISVLNWSLVVTMIYKRNMQHSIRKNKYW